MRTDFKKVQPQLDRLGLYAKQADEFNMKTWGELKSQCGSAMYDQPGTYQLVYGVGRDKAVWLSMHLDRYYDVGEFPTLKSFVDSFDGSWIYQIEDLEESIAAVRNIPDIKMQSWALNEMISLHEKQIEILKATKNTVEELKESNLYRKEAGLPKKEKMKKQTINITATNVQVGDHNQQQLVQSFNQLVKKIEESDAPIEEKQNALSRLKEFLNLPLVTTVAGIVVESVFTA
jgi:hypothetical protein